MLYEKCTLSGQTGHKQHFIWRTGGLHKLRADASVLLLYSDNLRSKVVGTVNNVCFKSNKHKIMFFFSFKTTVSEVLEAAQGFRNKANGRVYICVHVCVGLRGKMCLRVTEWTSAVFSHLGSLFFSCVAFLSSCMSSAESLRLQLETQADFVPTTVHVLPVDQT